MDKAHKIFPLGDAAACIQWGQTIEESTSRKIISVYRQLRESPFPGLKDLVPAYCSLSIYYDPLQVRKAQSKEGTIYDFVCCKLEDAIALSSDESEDSKQVFRVPVCYEPEYGPDLESICNMKRLEREEFIRIHTDSVYRVYMVGFLPGFTYLGTLDDRIRVQRKDQPVLVEAGSIGLAGYQTGIYPFSSPGGWQIIGRTPLRFFEPYAEVPVRLQMGDQVKFYPITGLEMREWKLQAETESAN